MTVDAVTSGTPNDPTVPDHLSEFLLAISVAMRADTATVLLLDPTRSVLDTAVSVGTGDDARQRFRVPVGTGFAGRIAAERQPYAILAVGPDTVVNPLLIRRGIQSLLGVPLLLDDDLVGVLHVGSLTPREFTAEETNQLQHLAIPLARSIVDRIAREDDAAAWALQRSLLPSRLPELPGLDLAARYIPADGDIGGDWYDVFELPHGRIGIVMGDVAGHGLAAAVVMGRLRSALRAYALDYDDPADVLEHLDRKAIHFEAGAMATVLYAVAAPPYDTLQMSLAGHLAPIAARDKQAPATPLWLEPDLPLGVDNSEPRRTYDVVLDPGTSICMFTDGLVERRPRRLAPAVDSDQLDAGLRQLQDAFRPGPADMACATIIDKVLPETAGDDVALLVLYRRELS